MLLSKQEKIIINALRKLNFNKIPIKNFVNFERYSLAFGRTIQHNYEQDGRLAPAYFSANYKYFDQLLQTVKNKTTVLILVFKEFLQTSI